VAKVREELVAGADDLASWAAVRGKEFFLEPDAKTLTSMRAVTSWASSAGYPPSAVNVFLQSADYYLVAQAQAAGLVVVTHEIPGATRRIKIPDACVGVGVSCMTPYAMLRSERARFVLGAVA
jgi:hypothetical protein